MLWFQTQVYGEHLSARVLSVTERGYELELESRGVNVAAALISEQLAKASGETAKEIHGNTTEQSVRKTEEGHSCPQVSDQTEVNVKDIPPERQHAVATEGQ